MSSAFDQLGDDPGHDDLFTPVSEKRLAHVWLLYGGQGTGKTYTSMTFPEPIFVIDTELRSDLTARGEFDDRDIRIFEPGAISFENVDPSDPLEDAIDIPQSLDNVNNAVITLVNGYREGDIEGGTVVLDSVTDLWDWTQEWGKQRLMQQGDVNEADFRLENQFDWGMIKSKHYKILTGLRSLAKQYGAEVVFTAREKQIPDYAEGGGEHYIKCENSVPFWTEINGRFIRDVHKGQTRHMVDFKKIGPNNQPNERLINPTYEDMVEVLETGEVKSEEEQIESEEDGDEDDGF